MNTTTNEQLILSDLANVFADFQGHEYSGPIDPSIRFFADLGLASIDAVVLGETLQERYGRSLPFDKLMAEMGSREDRDLTLGELSSFLAAHLEPQDIPHAEA